MSVSFKGQPGRARSGRVTSGFVVDGDTRAYDVQSGLQVGRPDADVAEIRNDHRVFLLRVGARSPGRGCGEVERPVG